MQVPEYMTMTAAEGTIEAGSEQQERLVEMTERLAAGEFHVAATATIPVICIDGRAGGFHLLPNAAGGSESIFVADDLTSKTYAGERSTTLSGYAAILNRLISKGYPVGGHDDDLHAVGASGCGANDKLAFIYDFLARQGDQIRTVAKALGVSVSDEIHATILANANARTNFSAGDQMLSELTSHDDKTIVEHLTGPHKEVIAVINTKAGTTLDRQALQNEFGDDYEAFNIDVWSFAEAAAVISQNSDEVEAKIAAMIYYNLATAHVLCGPNLRVIAV